MRSTGGGNTIRIPLNQGMNQSAGANMAGGDTPSLYYVQNMRMGGLNQELRKRRGFTVYTGAYPTAPTLPFETLMGDGTNTAIEKAAFVASADGVNLVGLTSGTVMGLDDSKDLFYPQARVSTCQPIRARTEFAGSEENLSELSTAFGNSWPSCAVTAAGYSCIVTIGQHSGDPHLCVNVYSPEGVRIWSMRKKYNSVLAKVVAVNETFVVCYSLNNTVIYAFVLTLSNGGVAAGDPAQVTATGAKGWDIASYGNYWYIVYQYTGTAERLSRVSGTTIDSTVICATGAASPYYNSISAVSEFAPTGVLWVGTEYYGRYGSFSVFTPELNVVRTQVSVGVAGATGLHGPPLLGYYHSQKGPTNQTQALMVQGVRPNGKSMRGTRVALCDSSEGTASLLFTFWGGVPVSKPDSRNRTWIWCENQQAGSVGRLALVRFNCEQGRVDATVELSGPPIEKLSGWKSPGYLPGSGGPDCEYVHGYFGQISGGATNHMFVAPQTLATVHTLPWAEIRSFEYSDSDGLSHIETEKTGRTASTSGTPHEILNDALSFTRVEAYDSPVPPGGSEIGWVRAPGLEYVSAASGTGVSSGTRTYRVCFEWVDTLGRRHLSAPSPPVSVTLSVSRDVTLYVHAMFMSGRGFADTAHNEFRPLLYRTQNGGTLHQRVPIDVDWSDLSDNGYWIFIDSFSDTAIADEEYLYTEGLVLPNDLAPSCRYVAVAGSRLWCGGLWDSKLIQASKLFVPREPINFADHDSFRVVLPAPVTGLAQQDDRLLVFCDESIHVIVGDGPNDQGTGQFETPVTLARGIGCSNNKSIVETDLGVIFQSRSGYWMVPRGLGPVQFIGAAVSDITQPGEDAAYCWSSCARTSEDGYLAYFLVSADADTPPSAMLVYDLVNSQWFFDSISGGPFREVGVWTDGIALVTDDLDSGNTSYPVRYQIDGVRETSDDGSSWITGQIDTPYLHPFGEGGWGKLRKAIVVLSSESDQTLTMRVRNSSEQLEDETRSVVLPTGSTDAFLYREFNPEQVNGSAWKLSIYDEYNDANSINFRPVALVLEVEDTGGVRPPGNSERF